jgi:hypothetical protein
MHDSDCWGNFNYVPDFIRFRERWADFYCGDADGWLLVWSDACILYLVSGLLVGALCGWGWAHLTIAPWLLDLGIREPFYA